MGVDLGKCNCKKKPKARAPEYCVCLGCGGKTAHEMGHSCSSTRCPICGTPMVPQGLYGGGKLAQTDSGLTRTLIIGGIVLGTVFTIAFLVRDRK